MKKIRTIQMILGYSFVVLLISCSKTTKNTDPKNNDPYIDTSFWATNDVKIYYGIFHRVDSSFDFNANGYPYGIEQVAEYNDPRTYRTKTIGDTTFLTFNPEALYTTCYWVQSGLDTNGYYPYSEFDSIKFIGDTLIIKGGFLFTDKKDPVPLKMVKTKYVGLLQH
ncbi:MAG TPA: hypothetical protein PKX92_07180 [Edaphocola sp.]|nr:hypothetical protein [Edaphocola sp.]